MRRSILFVLLMLLLLSSCRRDPLALDRFSGTEGLTLEFAPNSPPQTVYEGTPFPVKVYVHDQGAMDVPYSEMMLTFSTDPLYVDQDSGISPFFPALYDQERARTEARIFGKSFSYPDGEKRLYSIPADRSFAARSIIGQRSAPSTQITASVCYQYTTTLAAQVCIDTNVYEQGDSQQSCHQQDLSYAGGQGGPIAITQVEVQSFPIIDPALGVETIKPHFTIHFRNVGSGRLIGPDTLPLGTACFLKDIPKEDLSAIRLQAWLFDVPLECQPGDTIVLFNGEGAARCTVKDDDLNLFSSRQNYQTSLIINVSYIYKASTDMQVDIQRVPGHEEELPAQQKVSGYLYNGDLLARDENGQPITLCSYYANDPEQKPAGISIDNTFSCACDVNACVRLSADGQCLSGLCPGNSFCCSYQRFAGQFESYKAEPTTGLPSVGPDPDYAHINQLLEAASHKYGLPPDVLKAIAWKESTWDNTPPPVKTAREESYGIMQINVKAHPDYQIARGKEEASYNVDYGAKFFSQLLLSEGDLRRAISRYNGKGTDADNYAADVLIKADRKPWLDYIS